MEVLKEFPALWVIVGGILTGFMFWFLNRNVFSLTQTAQAQLANTYKEQLEAITKEKDYYRLKTHDQVKELQTCNAKVVELERKPDLENIFKMYREEATSRFTIYEQQSALLKELTSLVRELVGKFAKHEDILTKLLNRNGVK